MNGERDSGDRETQAPDAVNTGTSGRDLTALPSVSEEPDARDVGNTGTSGSDLTGLPDEVDVPTGEIPDRRPGADQFIHYEVNGERQQAEEPRLTVERALRQAGSAAGIDVGDIGNYYLERVSDGAEYRSLSDVLTIEDGDRFLAVYAGRTPVADSADDITRELRGLGFAADVLHLPGLGGDRAAVFDYPVDTGRHKGRTFRVGVSFQETEYPEYPPHFVWVAALSSPALPAHSSGCHDGVDWCAFSVPPSDFWDRLPAADKNMRTYMTRHMRRFWNQL